ncbi:transcriptional family [Leptolyngbya sp. Heron Island J]|uniref:AraC family transcriptional regulator n=1 Tax=Leptolyngbya sp. Heron Island J TaxID=1385935 RepID=UPI0003B9EDFE|nr:AraC family transcriptional regulator [Leptolyngbya sp. Heron Island J]ESA35150.1 transcriptional family [Leptolyngbya sp. Heron Island J]
MSLDLTIQEAEQLYAEAQQHCPPVTSVDQIEIIYPEPSKLGSGYNREMELCPGLELCIMDITSHDLTVRVPENNHLVQFSVLLSGTCDSGDHLQLNAHQSYVGGSGIQPQHFLRTLRSHRRIGVDIHMPPALFQQFFSNAKGELPASLQPLVQGNDWQHRFSPKTTGAIRTVVQQIIDCPFLGAAKRAYLQGKVFELIALQLDSISKNDAAPTATSPKADTVARLHYAAEILRSHSENPPSQIELAQLVGIGHSTLSKRFRDVFGMTPFAYLTRHRMEQAESFLRQPDCTVAEVANRVGYANPAQFAAAFKRHFGITPSECMRGLICHQP